MGPSLGLMNSPGGVDLIKVFLASSESGVISQIVSLARGAPPPSPSGDHPLERHSAPPSFAGPDRVR